MCIQTAEPTGQLSREKWLFLDAQPTCRSHTTHGIHTPWYCATHLSFNTFWSIRRARVGHESIAIFLRAAHFRGHLLDCPARCCACIFRHIHSIHGRLCVTDARSPAGVCDRAQRARRSALGGHVSGRSRLCAPKVLERQVLLAHR
jgi:hypothetical protein